MPVSSPQTPGVGTDVLEDTRVDERTKPTDTGDHERLSHYVPKDKLTEAAGAATEKVKAATSGSDDVGDQLNPDSLHFQDKTGPQGDLP